jgi:hypothetical protein
VARFVCKTKEGGEGILLGYSQFRRVVEFQHYLACGGRLVIRYENVSASACFWMSCVMINHDQSLARALNMVLKATQLLECVCINREYGIKLAWLRLFQYLKVHMFQHAGRHFADAIWRNDSDPESSIHVLEEARQKER